jgi:hypothetical protein
MVVDYNIMVGCHHDSPPRRFRCWPIIIVRVPMHPLPNQKHDHYQRRHTHNFCPSHILFEPNLSHKFE